MTINETCSPKKYYTLHFLDDLVFTLPIWLLFGHDYLGFGYLATMLVFTMPRYFFSGLLQIPCGAWADRHGRKAAYVLGTSLWVFWLIPYLVTNELWILVLIVPLSALGVALREGSLDAIMSSVAGAHSGIQFRDLASNKTTARYIARVVASCTGGLLYTWDERAPIAATLIAGVASFFIGLTLPASKSLQASYESRPTLQKIIRDTIHGFHNHKVVWTYFGFYALMGLAGEILWLSYQPLLAERGATFAALGGAFALFSLLSAAGSQICKYLMRNFSIVAILRIMLMSLGGCSLLFAAIPGRWSFLTLIPVQLTFGFGAPLTTTFLAARSPVELRATALSFQDVLVGIVVLVGGVTGALLLDFSSPASLAVLAALITACTFAATFRSKLQSRVDEGLQSWSDLDNTGHPTSRAGAGKVGSEECPSR